MLKHTIFLEKLTAKQKISLAANINRLADDEYADIGIPRVKFSTLEEIFARGGDGLTPYSVARTWDLGLISELTEKIIQQNAGDANAILVPAPKINLGAEAELALSEDPLLAKQIALAFLSAVNKCNKSGVISNFFLTKKEIANMDIEPDQRVLHDFIYEPFSTVAEKGNAKAVICSVSKLDGAYEGLNRTLIKSKTEYFTAQTDMLCLCSTQDETMMALDEGCIIFAGSEIAIQTAYDQYLSILSAVEKGRDSMTRLEDAIESKTAISDQMLNEAVDRIIDFAYRINGIDPSSLAQNGESSVSNEADGTVQNEQSADTENGNGEDTAENGNGVDTAENGNKPITDSNAESAEEAKPTDETAADESEPRENDPAANERDYEYEQLLKLAIEESTVLLKNTNRTLPLKRGTGFAIIGDVAHRVFDGEEKAFSEYFAEAAPGTCLATAQGYSLLEDRNDDLIRAALAAAKNVAAVFVFLKPRTANRASYPYTSIPANQIALLNALAKVNKNIIAIISSDTSVNLEFSNIVKGVILAPIAGKLSAEALAGIIFGKSAPNGKLTTSFYTSPGEFYQKNRYYKNTNRNKVGVFVGYRFYDSQDIPVKYPFGFGLRYSDVEISKIFYNSSGLRFTVTNSAGCDVDEIVEIYAGAERSKLPRPKKELKSFCRVKLKARTSKQITIKNPDLSVYDTASGANVVEGGPYRFYIGTSVSDIKAEVGANVSGNKISAPAVPISDYLQSKTNIISNTYTLEATHNKMLNYKSFKNGGLISLIVAILVGLMSFAIETPLLTIILGAVMLLSSVALLVVSNNIKARVAIQEAECREKNKENFKDAERADVEGLEELFLEEFKFDVADASIMPAETEENYIVDNTVMLNNEMSFDVAVSDLKKSMEESGIFIDRNLSAGIIASFVSSRLIITKSNSDNDILPFVDAIASYFGANGFAETVTEAHAPTNKLLYAVDEYGSLNPTAVLNAIVSAGENPETMHIVYLKNIPTAKISELLIPYIKYFSAPHSKSEIYAKGSDKTYSIPDNLWFIVELEHGTFVENVPSYILECAAVLPVKFSECQIPETASDIVPITLTDLEFLNERSRARYMLEEDVWKKIDAIEAFAFKHSSYRISNKLCLQAETYVAALLSAEIELPEAIDRTLASIILPPLASVLVGKIENLEKNLVDEVDRIFGEDNVQICREMLTSKA